MKKLLLFLIIFLISIPPEIHAEDNIVENNNNLYENDFQIGDVELCEGDYVITQYYNTTNREAPDIFSKAWNSAQKKDWFKKLTEKEKNNIKQIMLITTSNRILDLRCEKLVKKSKDALEFVSSIEKDDWFHNLLSYEKIQTREGIYNILSEDWFNNLPGYEKIAKKTYIRLFLSEKSKKSMKSIREIINMLETELYNNNLCNNYNSKSENNNNSKSFWCNACTRYAPYAGILIGVSIVGVIYYYVSQKNTHGKKIAKSRVN